jgi:2-keto-4-pentenoate hydratase/2-oxohepta-3-ene-1,7-dioic acid hydratase in catechol pathway
VKPAAALASPNEDIPINKFCASSYLDYEVSKIFRWFYLPQNANSFKGELVFVVANECRDLTPDQAEANILGYTAGNDLSCRLYQFPEKGGGQFFFAKAFDKFAPLGPVLVSAEYFNQAKDSPVELITKVNGEEVQRTQCLNDMIWSPAQILSHMSQG